VPVAGGPHSPVVAPHLDDDLDFALRLADAADEITAAAFTGSALVHELKADGSPVSDADIAVERRISEIIADERPADGVLGEEVGESGPRGRRWILDGIDGTVLFVAGVHGWATEIALEVDGEPVIGVTTSGAEGRRWWAARGQGTWRARRGTPAAQVRVTDRTDLAGSHYTVIPPLDVLGARRRELVERLGADAHYVRPLEHGALLVAEGRVDACVQLGGGAWDFAALSVIVEEAGGRFSDRRGRRDIYGGGPVVFSNGRVHDAVLASLDA
jgi:histidinol-phosphatase